MQSLHSYSCACLSSCSDIFDFLELKKNHGNESDRARDLFYGMWIPDLFMKRVEANGTWSLFCPNEVSGLFCRLFQTMQWYTDFLTQAKGLADVWGDEFEALYEQYEQEKKFRRTVPAQELWFAILSSQVETGTPYMLFKVLKRTSESESESDREGWSSYALLFNRMLAIASPTSRTWAPSSLPTCVPRLCSSPLRTRWPFATWLPLTSLPSWTRRTRALTSTSCFRFIRSSTFGIF